MHAAERTRTWGVLLMALLLISTLATATPALAQDPPSSSGEVPTQEIVPKPNSGEAPDEAGDRGGALQLGLLALVVVAVGLAVANLVRQSRRARTGGPQPPTTA